MLIQDAEDDIFEIYQYILEHDGDQNAHYVFEKLQELCFSLEQLPERGHVSPELLHVSVMSFLELHFKPYRVIYQIEGQIVFVHCVLDGRRDLQELLERRLLR